MRNLDDDNEVAASKPKFIRLSDEPAEHVSALRIALRSDEDAKLSDGNGVTGTVIIVHNDQAWTAVMLGINARSSKFKLDDKR